jgi:hypothetical protein
MGGSSLICRGGCRFSMGWCMRKSYCPLSSAVCYHYLRSGPPRGGGGRGQISPGPQVLRAPRNFLLGPSNYLGEIFPRKGQDIFVFFWAKYWNSVRKIEVKALESNYKVLVRKIFFTKKCCRKKIWNRGPLKKICPGPPPSSRRPFLRCPNLPVRRSVIILCLWSLYPLFITCAWLDSCCRTIK